MPIRTWLRPPRRLTALLLAVTIVPSVLLVALGWQLYRQDRAGDVQQMQDRRNQAADLVVSEFEQRLSDVERALGDVVARRSLATAEDAAVVVLSKDAAEAFPGKRLAYLPVSRPLREANAALFAPGEDLEHRQRDAARAAAWFRTRAQSLDPAIRAGALIRLARNLKKIGRIEEALAVYDQAAAASSVAVVGVPVDLLARSARCDTLASAGRAEDARRDAAALLEDLQHGQWAISRAVYDANATEARTWIGPGPAGPEPQKAPTSEVLAAVVSRVWDRWQGQPAAQSASSARDLDTAGGTPVVIVRRQHGDQMIVFVAGPRYVASEWLARVEPALRLQRMQVALRQPSAPSAGPGETRRVASETALPWTVAVVSDDEAAEVARLNQRRTLWLSAFGALTLVLMAGAAVAAFAVTRELAAARLQSDFVAAVSHEFRTPLTTMRQLTEALSEERIPSESRRQTYYQALTRQTDRLRRLVESLLDFGRMEAGSSPYRLQMLDAMTLVREVSDEFTAELAARGTTVEIQAGGGHVDIHADRDAMASALWNLLENAAKYSPDCRTIWVSVEPEPHGVAIRVRDRGFGIPHEEQTRIFEKFVRGSRAKADRIKGTGIGLSIVHHVVTAHGGEVRVESQPGVGSTFTVWLPA